MTKAQMAAVRSLWPQACARVKADADRVLQDTFLFDAPWDMEQTVTPVLFPQGVEWEHCPAQDEEWTFMLARNGFVRHLAQAWVLTGSEVYARKAFFLMEDFMRRAPLTQAAKGTTWRSLDAGIRIGNWLDAWALLRSSACVPQARSFHKLIPACPDVW